MLGRGVDQILPYPSDPQLRERAVKDARAYVELAERVHGPIPRPVGFTWPWGDALSAWQAADVRVVNLETSITGSGDFAPGKGIHYRMSPANLPCLTVGRPDVCALANNHVLDFGSWGLVETLGCLAAAKVGTAGAGRDFREAHRPAAVPLDGGRVLVFSFGTATSGIHPGWAATRDRPGVAFLADLSPSCAAQITDRAREVRRGGDIVVVSVHWGSNWGYGVCREQVGFAHALIDGGVDIVHGHSSHHPRPVEVYRGRLVLYGCGDFIDDYEGIGDPGGYRSDLRPLYTASVQATGALADLRIFPLQARQMRLRRACADDTHYLAGLLTTISSAFGTHLDPGPDGTLTWRPATP
jgi:poly-gamma-glutamate synthesis protein (capsule biosynthesis protein)